jgi:hypothetical protein
MTRRFSVPSSALEPACALTWYSTDWLPQKIVWSPQKSRVHRSWSPGCCSEAAQGSDAVYIERGAVVVIT